MLARIAPGLAAILASSRGSLLADARAGLAVAAVSIPTAIAYSGLMGVPAEAGLHTAILPLVVYALFGQAPRLIVGPDTATCVLIGGSLTALGVVDPTVRLGFAGVLAILAGLFCIGAGLLRLGAMADFLAWPILVGFLNGVALDLMLGQLPRMAGLPAPPSEPLLRLIALVQALPGVHWPTAILSWSALALVLVLRRTAPQLPGALLACIAAGAAALLLDLPAKGVAVLGPIPSELPGFALPAVEWAPLLARRYELLQHAAGIALISFTSFMVSARAFAARRGETTDADREAVVLGLANITGGLAKGFAVSGTSSRTAMNEAQGATSPVASLVAAGALAASMGLLAAPMAWLPRGVMAALMLQAALSLLDLSGLRALWRIDRGEAGLSLIATLGVLAVGPLNAVLVSVGLAIMRFVRITARPIADELGRLPGTPGFHSRRHYPEVRTEPGMVFFRFNGPIVFFNAPSFQRAALAAVDAAGPGLEWFVLDLFPITQVDATGLETLRQVGRQLAARGVRLVGAGRRTEARQWLSLYDVAPDTVLFFPTMNAARHAFRAERKARQADEGSAGR
jgi:high affinity sulfate transporter 1